MSPPSSFRIRPPGTVTSADLVSPSTTSVLIASSTASNATTPIRIFQPLPMAVVTLAGIMEKFVINGGVPLSGELTVAGNKNAALPILAACLLTEEELVLHRVPRIRDTEAQIALLERLGVEAAWVADNSLRLCAAVGHRRLGGRGALEEDPGLVSARRAAAGPLRRGEDAASRRRLHRPPAAGRPPRCLQGPRGDDRGRALDRAGGAAGRAAGLRDLHGRALGDGDRERADGGGADAGADDDRQRRLGAARPGPGPAAGQDGRRRSTGSAPT